MIASIIIARGGSRRLLRKNVLSFCGRPLVEWTILQSIYAHNIGLDNTYLTTDDDEIAAIGERNGIHIIRRPDYPNPDEITGTVIIRHAVKEIRKTRNIEAFIQIMPTCPMRFPDDIDRLVVRYRELKKAHPDCQYVEWVIPLKEIALYKYLNNEQVVYWLFDKSEYFALNGLESSLYESDWYIQFTSEYAHTDKGVDCSNFWLKPGKAGDATYCIDGKWFQQFNINTQEEFEFCELLMEKYILKGRGGEIYEEYGGKKDE